MLLFGNVTKKNPKKHNFNLQKDVPHFPALSLAPNRYITTSTRSTTLLLLTCPLWARWTGRLPDVNDTDPKKRGLQEPSGEREEEESRRRNVKRQRY